MRNLPTRQLTYQRPSQIDDRQETDEDLNSPDEILYPEDLPPGFIDGIIASQKEFAAGKGIPYKFGPITD